MKDQSKNDLRSYRMGRLTLLQLMSVLALVGVLTTAVLHYFGV